MSFTPLPRQPPQRRAVRFSCGTPHDEGGEKSCPLDPKDVSWHRLVVEQTSEFSERHVNDIGGRSRGVTAARDDDIVLSTCLSRMRISQTTDLPNRIFFAASFRDLRTSISQSGVIVSAALFLVLCCPSLPSRQDFRLRFSGHQGGYVPLGNRLFSPRFTAIAVQDSICNGLDEALAGVLPHTTCGAKEAQG